MQINAKTLLTPANFITITGFIMAVFGALTINVLSGVLILGLGRFLDLVDGPVARATGSSRFGAALDALCDKLAGLALLASLWHFQLAPSALLLIIFSENIGNAICSVIGEKRKITFVASQIGKYAIFLQNTGLVGFALLPHILSNGGHSIASILAWALSCSGAALGLIALYGYAQKAKIVHS